MLKCLTVVLMFAVVTFPAKSVAQATQSKLRTYYVAADEVEWDYAPGGINKMMGMKFEGNSKVFTERGPHRIGSVYRKALYREYTDATFTRLKPRAPEWATWDSPGNQDGSRCLEESRVSPYTGRFGKSSRRTSFVWRFM